MGDNSPVGRSDAVAAIALNHHSSKHELQFAC